MTTAANQKRAGLKSGTILMLGLILFTAGIYTAANLRLKAHRKTARSIAVLPFLSGTQTPEIDRFCDAVTLGIIHNLTASQKIVVTPFETVSHYRGNVLGPWKAGNELHVDVVVVGRVQRSHDKLIIQTDLMNVMDESQLWGRLYERDRPDLDTLSPEIAKDISDNVLAALSLP